MTRFYCARRAPLITDTKRIRGEHDEHEHHPPARAEVDELVRKALAAGGSAPNAPQDHGFMYGHGFEDLDGHLWELVYMSGEPPK